MRFPAVARLFPHHKVARKRDPPRSTPWGGTRFCASALVLPASLVAGNHPIPPSAPSKGDARQRTCGFVRAKPCWQGGESPRRRKQGRARGCHERCGCKSARICGKMRPHISGPSLWHDGLRRAGTARPTAPGKSQGFRLTTPRLQPSLSRFSRPDREKGRKSFPTISGANQFTRRILSKKLRQYNERKSFCGHE